MAEFVSYSTAVQVSGQAIRSVAEAMSDFLHVASDILKRHGISEPQPDRWYSQQAFLDSLKEVYEVFGTNTLTLIGRQIPDTAFLPRDIDSWEAALHAINVGYHMNHRGGEIGFYKFEQDGKLAGRVVCQCPYPSDLDLGSSWDSPTDSVPRDTCQRFDWIKQHRRERREQKVVRFLLSSRKHLKPRACAVRMMKTV